MPVKGEYQPLPQHFYEQSTIEVAKGLLGNLLVRHFGDEYLVVKIVETEAYLASDDAAAHNAAGRTTRNHILFGEPGRSYVYQLRNHFLFNVVTEALDRPSCVLLRAAEAVQGIETMRLLRGPHIRADTQLMSGPGKLCKALAIDLALYGIDLTSAASPLYIAKGEEHDFQIEVTTRIGITKDADKPLRFLIKDNPFVSKSRLSPARHRRPRNG